MADPKKNDDAADNDDGPQMVVPLKVRFIATHGFEDESGTRHFWEEGHEVTDPKMIATLIERGSPIEAVE